MRHNIPSLSIITPTYNRADLLKRCYKSLCNQSNFDFEWIVVDDGSTDATRTVMDNIANCNKLFSIRYIWKENGGKHTALNAAHPYISGKYVLILDSDDMLTPDAVELVLTAWKRYEDNKDVGIVTFLRKNIDGQVLAYVKDENIPVDILQYQRTIVISNDCCEVIRGDLLKKYPFPVFKGEHFLAETALWYRVGLETNCVYINNPIYICEYLEGGLTKSGKKLRINNPRGGMYTSYLRMNKRCSIKERVKAGLLYICYGFFADEKVKTLVTNARPHQFLAVVCLIPGMFLYFMWKKYLRG